MTKIVATNDVLVIQLEHQHFVAIDQYIYLQNFFPFLKIFQNLVMRKLVSFVDYIVIKFQSDLK